MHVLGRMMLNWKKCLSSVSYLIIINNRKSTVCKLFKNNHFCAAMNRRIHDFVCLLFYFTFMTHVHCVAKSVLHSVGFDAISRPLNEQLLYSEAIIQPICVFEPVRAASEFMCNVFPFIHFCCTVISFIVNAFWEKEVEKNSITHVARDHRHIRLLSLCWIENILSVCVWWSYQRRSPHFAEFIFIFVLLVFVIVALFHDVSKIHLHFKSNWTCAWHFAQTYTHGAHTFAIFTTSVPNGKKDNWGLWFDFVILISVRISNSFRWLRFIMTEPLIHLLALYSCGIDT